LYYSTVDVIDCEERQASEQIVRVGTSKLWEWVSESLQGQLRMSEMQPAREWSGVATFSNQLLDYFGKKLEEERGEGQG
jgi:hypothetical protein